MAFLILCSQPILFDVSQIGTLSHSYILYINFHLSDFSKHTYKTLFYMKRVLPARNALAYAQACEAGGYR